MCGRYTLILLHDLKTIFPWITAPEVEPPPRYNIAPSQPILAATNDVKPGSGAKFDFLHWGFIPSWAKDRSIGNRMINGAGGEAGGEAGISQGAAPAAVTHPRPPVLRV